MSCKGKRECECDGRWKCGCGICVGISTVPVEGVAAGAYRCMVHILMCVQVEVDFCHSKSFIISTDQVFPDGYV